MGTLTPYNDKAEGQRPCAGCDVPINDEDLGGMAKGKDGTMLWFHNDASCIMKTAEVAAYNHRNDLRKMGKELSNGKEAIISEKLRNYAPNPSGAYEF